MSERRLWTCIIDFQGGTYLRQVWMPSSRDVLPIAIEGLRAEVPELASAFRVVSADDIRTATKDIVRIAGFHAVECVTLTVGDDLLIANIVETVPPPS